MAYLINSYPLPSQTFIRREIRALERAGWQVERFALRLAAAEAGPLAQEARRTTCLLSARAARAALSQGIARPLGAMAALWLALRCGARGARGVAGTGGRLRHLAYWLEGLALARLCRARGLRHVHAHFGTNSATVAMLAARAGGLGFSFTCHGPEEFDAPLPHALPEKIARACFVVAISGHGRGQLYRWARAADWPKIHVIRCGLEREMAPPRPLPRGGPHLVAVGRLAAQKGWPVLLAALARVRRRLPGLHLRLIGDGPLRPALLRQVAALGLEDCVELAGWRDEAGVRRALEAAQALVLPSLAEGLPVVVTEAMAAARPVIATTIAGVPELVTPDCGWLVTAGSEEALANAILELAAQPPARLEAMGQAGRARVGMLHDIEREVEALSSLFRAASAGGAGRD